MEEDKIGFQKEISFFEKQKKMLSADTTNLKAIFFPFFIMEKEVNLDFLIHGLNPITLAYLGDAVYEMMFRSYIIHRYGGEKIFSLHKKGIAFANASSQSRAVHHCYENGIISEEEWLWVKKGRNQHSTPPKNASPSDYRYATGFETLIGMLYLKGEIERIVIIVGNVVSFLENKSLLS